MIRKLSGEDIEKLSQGEYPEEAARILGSLTKKLEESVTLLQTAAAQHEKLCRYIEDIALTYNEQRFLLDRYAAHLAGALRTKTSAETGAQYQSLCSWASDLEALVPPQCEPVLAHFIPPYPDLELPACPADEGVAYAEALASGDMSPQAPESEPAPSIEALQRLHRINRVRSIAAMTPLTLAEL